MSETSNRYWDGTAHAVLTRETVSARWGSGSHSSTRIDAANRAFCIWYHARKTIAATTDAPHVQQMRQSLEDCATEGWGSGVSDLQEALNHLAENNDRWTDDNTETYFGGNGKAYNHGLISDMPEGCTNFLDAVDEKLPELQRIMQDYQARCQALERMRPSPTQRPSDWEQIKTNLDAIKTTADRAKPLLWLGPAVVHAAVPSTSARSAARRIEAFADGATPRVEGALKFLDVVGNIHDALTVYVDASRAMGGDRRAGVAFAALTYAMTFVPVLGGFYGAIVQKIPGLITNWRTFMTSYTRRFDDPEAWLRARANRQPAWRCPICNSSGGYV